MRLFELLVFRIFHYETEECLLKARFIIGPKITSKGAAVDLDCDSLILSLPIRWGFSKAR